MKKRPGNEEAFHTTCITGIAATIDTLLGVPVHEGAEAPIATVMEEATKHFQASKVDRVFMYNPDAIASWMFRFEEASFAPLLERCSLSLPMLSVFPPVTPVCFSSMYSGFMPAQHGILKYEKPILQVKTVFDDLPAAGRKVAIVSTEGDSISMVFLNRPIDYYIYPTKEECNRKAFSLIHEDTYDLIVLYNGDYDHYMHRHTPTGARAIRALHENIETYCLLHDTIQKEWSEHKSVLAFAPDHGCHRWLGLLGNHGLNEPCDMNIHHFYSFIG